MKKWIAIVVLVISIILVGYTSNRGVLTKEKFNEIQVGMTIEDVVDIIGVEGEISAEAGEPGTAYYTVLYTYSGDEIKGSAGATANFQFIGNKLAAKVQYGLK